jgi:hypothetical protein
MPESVPSTLAITTKALYPWISDTVSRVADAAGCISILLLGSISAAFVVALLLHVMGILINPGATTFIREKAVGRLVAKSLGKTMGGIAVAWKER